MILRLTVTVLLLLGSIHVVPAQERSVPPPMVNGDVVKLVNGGLSKDLIIHTIESSPNRFDLSADALLDLKKKGVPDDVIQAMVSPQNKPASLKDAPPFNDISLAVFGLYDDTKKIRMEQAHTVTNTKVGLRALIGVGYGYVTLTESGPAAALRVTNKKPVFGELDLPLNTRVAESVYLVKLEIDPDTKHRRVQTAKVSLFGGNQLGFPQEIRIPVEFKEVTETTSAKSKYLRTYQITPATAMEPGEYAVVNSMREYYDFGIDP